MLRVIRQLWVFSRFISEIQSSPAAPGYRQSRHKRKKSRTRWLPPAYKNARKKNNRRERNLAAELDSLKSKTDHGPITRQAQRHFRYRFIARFFSYLCISI